MSAAKRAKIMGGLAVAGKLWKHSKSGNHKRKRSAGLDLSGRVSKISAARRAAKRTSKGRK